MFFSRINIFLLRLYFFRASFRFRAKLRGRYRDFLYTLCPHTCTASSIINIPHHSGTSVTTDGCTLTYHNHPESTLTFGFTLGVAHSVGLDKWIFFQCPKISLCSCLFIPLHTLTLGNCSSFYCLHSFAFFRTSGSWNHIACSLFTLTSFT